MATTPIKLEDKYADPKGTVFVDVGGKRGRYASAIASSPCLRVCEYVGASKH